MSKQFYILEMNNFTEEEAEQFLSKCFDFAVYKQEQGIMSSHLNEKGIERLKKHVLKQEKK